GVTTETHPARRDCGIDPEDAVTRVHEHEVDRATHPEGMDRAAWGNPDRVSAGECLATDESAQSLDEAFGAQYPQAARCHGSHHDDACFAHVRRAPAAAAATRSGTAARRRCRGR